MLERLNIIDFRYRKENEDTLLGYNVITAQMYFFKGNVKAYIESLINNTPNIIVLENKYINYLIDNNILIRSDNNEV